MPKNLVIVESPAKARTIERYLGEDYRVLASYGHVRDLPENPGKGKFGVDVDNDFAPEYVINDDRRKQVSEIEKAARGSETVFLATDLDREGEAIAWHVAEAAHVPAAKTRRVTFSEITESAIREAFAHPRDIDQNLVDAQQTRRIVDRLVGYTLSPLIGKKVRRGLSAGRVQSVAVRLVVERERAIDAFTTREYWTIQATLATSSGDTFAAELVRIDGEALDIADEVAASRHVTALRDASPVVRKITVRTQKRSPAAPFTTSTLQQEASRKLSFSPKRTMSVAQRLYEGMATPDGQAGLITYMRTDSTAIAGVAMGEAREVIAERYGDAFTMPKGRVYKTKAKGAQEAHESIRPTSFRRDPDSLAGVIPADELRLYRLIWQRALASQMAPKELETTTIDLADMPYELRASATKTLFEGFARVYTEGRDDAAEDEDEDGTGQLPALAESDATSVREVTPTQHFTEPPPRFTEATLIKALEEHGIGRPSTYAATISTILDRGYVRVEERRLHPDPLALVVTDYLVEHFGDYVDLAFTARMEEELDEVATGERAWVPLLRAFYGPLTAAIRTADDLPGPVTPTDEVCSEDHPMVIRFGRNGRFLACSLYPDHKETRPLPEDAPPPQEGEGEPCPECGQGTLVGKSGRFGPFVGCSRYPDCKFIKKDGPPPPDPLPFEVVCPRNQDGLLVPRRARRTGNVFWGCAKYPKCDFTTNHEPLGGMHDTDDGPLARKGETAICLRCGSASDTAPDDIVPGERYAGGPADPAALARPARTGRAAGGPRGGGRGRAAGARTGGARATGRRTSPPEPAAGA